MSKDKFLQTRVRSFGYAFKGIAVLLMSQANAWIHATATIVVATLGLYFHIKATEWCFLLLAMALVWVAEAVNTALEFLTDLVSPDYHVLAGKAKDVAAGAVLIAAIFAVLIGGIIFVPYFLNS